MLKPSTSRRHLVMRRFIRASFVTLTERDGRQWDNIYIYIHIYIYKYIYVRNKLANTLQPHQWNSEQGLCFKIKTVLSGLSIPIIKIKQSWDRVIFIMGIRRRKTCLYRDGYLIIKRPTGIYKVLPPDNTLTPTPSPNGGYNSRVNTRW